MGRATGGAAAAAWHGEFVIGLGIRNLRALESIDARSKNTQTNVRIVDDLTLGTTVLRADALGVGAGPACVQTAF